MTPPCPAPRGAAQRRCCDDRAVSERETLTYELFGTAARELAEQ
ncbi:hypothetical protein ACI79C_07200 [Geodermatophilus sp. SYSU D00697]